MSPAPFSAAVRRPVPSARAAEPLRSSPPRAYYARGTDHRPARRPRPRQLRGRCGPARDAAGVDAAHLAIRCRPMPFASAGCRANTTGPVRPQRVAAPRRAARKAPPPVRDLLDLGATKDLRPTPVVTKQALTDRTFVGSGSSTSGSPVAISAVSRRRQHHLHRPR